MSILKRGQNTWLIKIYLGRGEDGKPKYHYETFYTPIKSLAQDRERDLKKQLRAAKQGPNSNIVTLGQWIDVWLRDVRKSVAPATWTTYESCARAVKPFVGHLVLWTLDSRQLKDIMEKHFLDVSNRTQKNMYAFVRMVVRAAICEKKAPIDALQSFQMPREEKVHRDTLSREDMRRLVGATERYRYGLVIRLLVLTGARAGEILGLTWDAVDFATRSVTINKSLNIHTRELNDRPKTENSRRTVILDEETVELLKQQKEKQRAELRALAVTPLNSDTGLVFLTQTGKPVKYSSVQKTFAYCLERAELPHMRIHDLRHSLITLLLLEGTSVLTVASLVGQDPSTTTQKYAHLTKISNAISL